MNSRNNREANAGLRSILNAMARLNGPDSEDVTGRTTHITPFSYSAERPGAEVISELLADPTKADDFLSARVDFRGKDERLAPLFGLICCNILKHRGHDCLKSLDYQGGRRYYLDAIAAIVGKDFKIPLAMTSVGMRSKAYRLFDPWQRADMMGCCNGLAECMMKLGELEEALLWLDEVNILYKHTYYTSPQPLFDWKDYNLDLTELFAERITAFARQSTIFMELGNTAAAVHRRWVGGVAMNSMPSHHDKTSIRRVIDFKNILEFMKLRHPDPSLVAKATCHNSALQVRGSWQKLNLSKPSSRPGSRLGFACIVWNGRVYIAGGVKNFDLLSGPYYRDMWCFDLQKLNGWRELPSYPIPGTATGFFLGWTMVVHNDKAYVFNGRPQLDFFDLVNEKWGSLKTKMKIRESEWPYDGNQLTDYTIHSINGKLFVFGGNHERAHLGCNILMMLDLETLQWELLSGSSQPTADYACPGPRRHHISWVDNKQDRIYIMYGVADRPGAKVAREPHAASEAYAFEDMWSWSIESKKWRRERIMGNSPSPRSEMAHVYNPTLDKVIVFGGYSPSVGTFYAEANKNFTFSYYADTFLFDVSTSKWKQVVTRGFPTYRAQARMFVDPTTGKTFLFGGYTNADYVPSRKNTMSRSFGDFWQLCIDEPGGFFEGIDYEEEARTANAGPWQRCFTCGCAGQCQKCGGTCKGSAFFCDSVCLKEGWKEHKEKI